LNGGVTLARARDDELQAYLSQSGVEWDRLDETARLAAEETWRGIYGQAFRGRPRLRHEAKADYDQHEPCTHYLIVPLSANVPGLPMDVRGRQMDAYECRGPLVPLGAFHDGCAALALGRIGPEARDALPALRESASKDRSPVVRRRADEAVQRIESP
jgi:hypothetical protein